MRTPSALFLSGLVAAIALAAPVPLRAEPAVLAVDGDDVYVDLGSRDGVGAGAALELVRAVVVRDPASGATLRDRFALGRLIVERAGDHVALTHPEPDLGQRARVGDEVRLASERRAFADPWAEKIAAAQARASEPTPAPGVGTDRAAAERVVAETEAVHAVWTRTLGLPPADRIALWRGYLADHGSGRYAGAVRQEIDSLVAQEAALEQATAAADAAEPVDRRRELSDALAALTGAPAAPLWVAEPARVLPGRAIALAFAVAEPARTRRGWLYARAAGGDAFRRLPLTSDGDAYLRGEIPAELVAGDGVDWYVEVASDDGPPEPALGSREAPRTIDVARDVTEPPPAAGRSQVSAVVDYVDFDGGLARGHDQYYQAEIDFGYRFLQPVHAVRLGFGTLSGTGGPKDVIDADPAGQCRDDAGAYRCRRVDFSYVYTEIEIRPQRVIALMLRPQAGLLTTDRSDRPAGVTRCRSTSDLRDCDFLTGLGVRARVRFGEERGTHLVLGAGFTQGVGTLFEANYHWAPQPVIPVLLAVQVTDQPVPEDFGVRLIADVGWRGASWVYPSMRVSYQARDIDHAGLSGGVGLTFDW